MFFKGETYENSSGNCGPRGSGVLRKGQYSWNISVKKEARVDPKVVLELSAECPFGGIFFCPIFFLNKRTYFKKILQALLLVTNQAEPIKGLLTAVHLFV